MASQLFLEKIQGAVLSGEQFYSYQCSFLTRNGACASERGINSFGPKHLTACRRHGRMYEEEHENLKQRLKMDHDQGFHGQGDARKPFAEIHTDSSGFFNLVCTDCRDELKGEELGVAPDKLEEAQTISQYVERIQNSWDHTSKRFRETIDRDGYGIIAAMDQYGEELRGLDVQRDLVQEVLKRMKAYEEDLVVAFNAISQREADNLIRDRVNDEERPYVSRFVRLGKQPWQ